MNRLQRQIAINRGRHLKRAAKKVRRTNKSYVVCNLYDKKTWIARPTRVYRFVSDALERYRLTALLEDMDDFKVGIRYRKLDYTVRGKPKLFLLPWAVSKAK